MSGTRTNSIVRLRAAAVFAAAIWIANAGHCQVQQYQLTMPLSGHEEVSISDWGNNAGIHPNVMSMDLAFSSLSETIYLDPVNMTVRQVGLISLQSGQTSQTFQDGHYFSGQFASTSLTLSQNLPNGGLSFDTGAQPIVWDASSHQYTLNAPLFGNSQILNLSPISGSYSFNIGQQTYTGNFSYALQNQFNAPHAFTTFAPGPGGRSLIASGLGMQQDGGDAGFSSHQDIVDVTAADGFQLELMPGEDDGVDYFDWSADGPPVATEVPQVVPEPGSYVLIGLGLAGLFFLRRKGN